MDDDRKKRLVDLGTETLAESLLELASRNNAADDLVERMIATPVENIQRFKTKLAALKRSHRFVRWSEAAGFARELQDLLQALKAGVSDPKQGTELVAAFYETDKGTLGNCDDSSGHVGDVYRFDAKELFVGYARRCPDKEWLVNLVLKLNRDDDYGVRDTLIDCAAEYLPEPYIRTLISRLQEAADKEKDEVGKRRRLHLIESLARQIGDATLFEKTRIAAWGKLSTAACVDIARVYLESGDARTALSWLEKISADDTFQAHERDRLLLEIFGQLGESQKQAKVAWRMFRRHRCKDSLEALLSVIGVEQNESVMSEEIKLILASQSLSLSDAAFLVEMGRIEEAEHYLLERSEQLNGDFYGSLLPLAEAMETGTRHLAATVVYRALLDSILRRGQTKTYPHGVRYLKKLDRLAKSLSDWRGQGTHDVYLQQLRLSHGRKSSFWSQYER